jgi:hypothetical protein
MILESSNNLNSKFFFSNFSYISILYIYFSRFRYALDRVREDLR